MPVEVRSTSNLGLTKGQNRVVFRNPRGNKNYYVFYTNSNQAYYEWSSDGVDWTETVGTITANPTNDVVECIDVKIYDNGSSLTVFVVMALFDNSAGGTDLLYRRGTIPDASNPITWTAAVQNIDSGIVKILSAPMCAAIARTDNGELVIAYTEDFGTMGKDYRRTYLLGSDGDGGSPSWSGVTLWDDPSGGNNNDLKGDVWFGLENFGSTQGDRVLIHGRFPDANDSTDYAHKTGVPDWGGTSFSNTTQANNGLSDTQAKVVAGLIDAADFAHIIYWAGGATAELKSRKAGTAGDDDWSSTATVKAGDVDACTLTLDTGPATDELYIFYHDAADSTDFHYKTTPVDTISWSSEETVTFSSDLIALSSWSRDVESGLHIGIEDADTDIWYHELDVSVGGTDYFESLSDTVGITDALATTLKIVRASPPAGTQVI
jgi:hypothetical protein